MSVKADLIEARAVIADPAKWFKGSRSASGFCAVSAIHFVTGTGGDLIACRKALEAELTRGWSSVIMYNDARTTTHADIMALFDRAIEHAE